MWRLKKPLESVADKYFGIFKAEEYPDDIDRFLEKEIVRKWLRNLNEDEKSQISFSLHSVI